MAQSQNQELDILYGLSFDGGKTFLDKNMNYGRVQLWDSHTLHDTHVQAKKALEHAQQAYDGVKIYCLNFSVQITEV